MRKSVILSLLLLAGTGLGWAQLNRGSLAGTVADTSGAPVVGARINVLHIGTQAAQSTVSNEAGQYRLASLPVGAYSVTFEMQGFKKLVRTNVEVDAAAVVRVDAALEVGGLTESITVTAEVPKVTTDTPEVAATLGGKEMQALPLIFDGAGRTAENFAYKIMPGISGNTWRSAANGSTAFSKESLLDGATVTTYLAGHMGESHVPVESLQEFKVQTSGMSAEYGRTQGGVFNYVMRSGSNDLHGNAYQGVRNEALNANTFANNFAGRPRGKERKLSTVGSIGGPVVLPKLYNGRNKTFFWTTYERTTERLSGLGNLSNSIPVPEFYEGDFSRLLGAALPQTDALGRPVYRGAIYDPSTFRQVAGGRWVGDMFPQNRIPAARFSQVSKNINAMASKYIPDAKDPDGRYSLQRNSYGPFSSKPDANTFAWTIKGDHNLSSAHRLSGSYLYNAHPRLRGAGGMWDPTTLDGGDLATTVQQRTKAQSGRLAWDWIASPTVLNHAILSVNRMGNPSRSTRYDVDGAAKWGIKNLSSQGYPIINWGGGPVYTLANPGQSQFDYTAYNSWGFANTTSFNRGRHFMKAGYDMRGNQLNNRPGRSPSFTFAARGTAIPNESFSGTTVGYSFASYLLGVVDTASLMDPAVLGGRRRYYALFFQDDFKVNNRLTLQLGLRWEYQAPGTEVADRYASWTPDVKDPISGLGGAYAFAGSCSYCAGQRYFGVRSFRDFGPRIGFAYRLTSKTTLRGAYGILFEGDLFNGYNPTPLGKATSPQEGGTYNLNPDPVTPWVGLFNWDAGFPANRYVPPVADPSWGNTNRPGMVHPDYGRSPYIQMWNFNIQRELPWKMVLDLGYIANKGTQLRNGDLMRLNQVPASALSQYGTNLTKAVTNPQEAAAYGIAYPFPGYRGTVAGAIRQYPQLSGTNTVNVFAAPLGFSTFHSFQAILDKQFSNGLTVYANYVWAKSLTNTEGSFVNDNAGPMDYFNLRLEKAVSSDDVPHTFKGLIDYQLPFGKGKRWMAGSGWKDALAGGWGASAILNYAKGTPLGFAAPSPMPNGWNGGNRANVAAGAYLVPNFDMNKFEYSTASSPNNTYLNKSLFSAPAALTLGTSAPRLAQIRPFGIVNEDVSLYKNFTIAEKIKFQLRADFLDVFNRYQLGAPNTDVTNPLFGQITSVNGNRTVQLGARVDF